MCQSRQAAIPSFLFKLQEILDSNLYSHIIRWDKTGEAICIVCIQALQEIVLPIYFRHSKFSSFVRQLNMYGFHKRKADKNISAAFYNQYFSKGNIIFSAMSKKNKKDTQIHPQKDNQAKERSQIQQHKAQHEYSTQYQQNSLKMGDPMKQINQNHQIIIAEDQANGKKLPEVNQLIAELEEKAFPLLTQMDWLKSRQLELLLKQPRFLRVNFAVLGFLDIGQISPFADVLFPPLRSDRMELIL